MRCEHIPLGLLEMVCMPYNDKFFPGKKRYGAHGLQYIARPLALRIQVPDIKLGSPRREKRCCNQSYRLLDSRPVVAVKKVKGSNDSPCNTFF